MVVVGRGEDLRHSIHASVYSQPLFPSRTSSSILAVTVVFVVAGVDKVVLNVVKRALLVVVVVEEEGMGIGSVGREEERGA